MGNFFGGGNGGMMGPTLNTTNTVSTVAPPPKVQAMYDQILPALSNVASTPWQNYGDSASSFVSPLNQSQQAGISNLGSAPTMAQPYIDTGLNYMQQGANYISPAYNMAQSAGNSTVANNGVASSAMPYYNNASQYTQQGASQLGGSNYADPYFNNAYGLINQGGQGTNQVGQSDINQYMSPYQQSVVNSTMNMLGQQNEMSMQGALGNVIKNGGFGNDRSGVMMANQNQQNQLSNAQVLGQLNNQNYAQALNAAVGQRAQNQADLQRQLAAGQASAQVGQAAGQLRNQDLSRMLAAGQQMQNIGTAQRQGFEQQQQFQQADLARQLGASQAMGQYGGTLANIGLQNANLGLQNQANYINANNALMQAGTMQQQTEQAGKDAMYNQWLQSKAYPFMTGQWLADMYSGFGPLYGSQTNQSGSSISMPLSFSDPKLKTGVRAGHRDGGTAKQPEVIGKTFDDQPIYRYSLMGGPAQLGLMADEVAQRDPGAVGGIGGLMTLDYARATDKAADMGHEMHANHRAHKDLGGALATQAQMYAMLKKHGAQGPGGNGFVPQRQMSSKGALQGSPMQMREAQIWKKDLHPVDIMGSLEKAKGLSGLGKGGSGGIGGAFDTVAKLFNGAPDAATAVAQAAPSAASAASAAADAAKPIIDAGTAASNVADASDLLPDFFAARGGRIHRDIGGDIPFADEMQGSIVPQHHMKHTSMPVAPPLEMGSGQGQKSGSSSGSGLDMLGSVIKGAGTLGSLASSLSSLGTAGAAAGAAGAAGSAAGGIGGLLAFLPFLSDPRAKTGVGTTTHGVGSRRTYGEGGPENGDGHSVAVRSQEAQGRDDRPVDVGSLRAQYNPNYNPGGFDDIIKRTFKYEGGYNPNDAGHGPSNHGINQQANPDIDVRNLSQEGAKNLYQHRYWDAANIDSYPAAMRAYGMDTSVNMGPGRAKQFMEQSGGDPEKYHQLRANFYQHLIDSNPEKYGRYASAWAGRMNAEAQLMGLNPIALNYNGHSHIGHGGGGPEYDGGGGDLPPGARDYVASGADEGGGLGSLLNIALPIGGAIMQYNANRHVLGGGPAGLSAIAGGLGMLGSMTDADIQRRHLEQQMELERRKFQLQQNQEDRAAKTYQREEDEREADKKLLESNPGQPAAPAGGWGPPVKQEEQIAPVNPPPGENSQKPPMSVTPNETPQEPASTQTPGIGGLNTGKGDGISNVNGESGPSAQPETRKEATSTIDPEAVHATQTGMPAPSKFWPKVVDEQNPYFLRAQADYFAQQAERFRGNPRMQQQAQLALEKQRYYLEEARKAENSQTLFLKDGTSIVNPYAVEAEGTAGASIERKKAQATKDVENANTLDEYQPEVGGPTISMPRNKALELANKDPSGSLVKKQPKWTEDTREAQAKEEIDLKKQMEGREVQRGRLARMLELQQSLETGSFSTEKAKIYAALDSLGLPVDKEKLRTASEVQQFIKNATQQTFAQVTAMGGRPLVAEIEGLARANANPDLRPEANRQIIARGIGQIDYLDDYYRFFNKWRRDNPGSIHPEDAYFEFKKTHNLEQYENRAVKRAFAKGSENEPPTFNKEGVPSTLFDLQKRNKLQRKGDKFRNIDTGQIYDKYGRELEETAQ